LQAHGHNIIDFQGLLAITDDNKCNEILSLIQSLKGKVKSKLLPRLELAVSKGVAFKEQFTSHLTLNIKQSIPSIFFSIKYIYKYQPYKISLIEEVLNEFLEKSEKKETFVNPFNNEKLDLGFLPHMDFVYYYASQHYDYLKNLEKALIYINRAIDQTPSYVEFYMIKSKILKHASLFSESAAAYEKVTCFVI
jgi:peptide alpha-N-acetyltransferase